MCAIAGILGPASPAAKLRVQRMVAAQHHRGPDSSSIVDVNVLAHRALTLGHARLSVLDLTAAASQPMVHVPSGSWLAFNGEIYNFQEIRKELEVAGHGFASTGDTEVLLRALVQWDLDALGRLRGMFAFAYWDGIRRTLTLGRDPFGIKPLLYARKDDSLLFASELRGIRAAGVQLTRNDLALEAVLAFGFVPEPATACQEALALEPGAVLRTDATLSNVRLEPVLDLASKWRRTRVNGRTFRETREQAHELLDAAVSEQLNADVPVGVFLSGGIDSTLVAALAAKHCPGRTTLLTVGFPEAEFSELEQARAVAQAVSGTHRVIQLDEDRLLSMLPGAIAAMDQPTVDGINTYVVSKLAAESGLKVVLSGLGGDELFAGYTTFWKTPLLWKHARAVETFSRLAPPRLMRPLERLKIRHATACRSLLDAYLLQRSLRNEDPVRLRALLPPGAAPLVEQGDGLIRVLSLIEATFYMRNQLLRDSDVFSSANSIELRVPLLDLRLAELAWSTPTLHLLRPDTGGKRVLKSLVRQLLPSLSVQRKKRGFTFPWRRWLRKSPLRELVRETVLSRDLYSGLSLSFEQGRGLLEAFDRGDSTVGWGQVWATFIVLRWVQQWQTGT